MPIKFLLRILFILSVLATEAQVLEGIIYDETTAVKQVSVINKTQNILVVTNEYGQFKINAHPFDSIAVVSPLHQPLAFKVIKEHFKTTQTYHLISMVNELDEVLVSADKTEEFDLSAYNSSLRQQIRNDMKNNPGQYALHYSRYGLDFARLFGLIASLLKKDKAGEPITYADSYDLHSLFQDNSFFNQELLVSNLGIKKDHSFLFFEYCAAKGLETALLKDESKLELLDSLVIRSNEFKLILDKTKNERDR